MTSTTATAVSPELRLVVSGLKKSYGRVPVIKGMDLDVSSPEFVTLLGPSGCGKTTLLRCVAGLETIDQGEIRLGDRVLNSARERVFVPPDKRNLGMVFQSYALWPHMTVLKNVTYPLRVKGTKRPAAEKAAMEVLELVGLAHTAQRPVSQLSGGQQQRVSLARAIVGSPSVMLLDEPLSNIDAALREELGDYILRAHRAAGALSLYVTHDQSEALHLSDRIAIVTNGAIQQVGSPQSLYASPANKEVAAFLGYDNFFDGTVVSGGSDCLVRLTGSEVVLKCRVDVVPAVGAKVVVAVRSGHLVVSAQTSVMAGNGWRGVLREVRQTRSSQEYYIATGGVEIKVRIWDSAATASTKPLGLNAGDDVYVEVDPTHAVALPAPVDAVV